MKAIILSILTFLSSHFLATAQSTPIPGIYAVDIYGNLTNKGFKLEKIFQPPDASWICTLSEGPTQYRAETYGKGPTKILSVRGTVIDTGGNLKKTASDFLGYLASIPYDGADPNKARAWVIQNINTTTSTVINGVRFEINAKGPAARILTITKNEG